MRALLQTLGWMAAIVYSTVPSYWLVVHAHPERWRHLRKPLLATGALWFLMWIVVGAITWPWRKIVLYESNWGWLLALPLFAVGFFLYTDGTRRFSIDQVLGRSEIQPDRHVQHLDTSGFRQRVRHPLYLGHACELLAWALGTGLAVVYVLLALGILTGVFMVRAEESELEARFGQEYREYKQRVPAFFPRF